MSGSNPALPGRAESFQGRPAGIVSRTLAALVDVAVVAAIMLAAYAVVSAVKFGWNPRAFSLPRPPGWFVVTAVCGIATAYLSLGWWTSGRTYGCAVLGLRVVGPGGRDLRFAPSLVRAAVCVLFPLGLGWCAVDPRSLALHDLLARSHVLYDWHRR